MQSHLRLLLTVVTLASVGGCGGEGTDDETAAEAAIGTAEEALATCDPCPVGSYDGSLCRLAPPEGTTPFIWMNNFYATPVATPSCPLSGSTYDSVNCLVATPPAGTTAFIWEGHLYHTPVAGDSCPLAGSMFDGYNCIVATPPAGTTPFVHENRLYHTPVYTHSCPAGTYYDGSNCYVGTPPDGRAAFVMDDQFHYTPLCDAPAPVTPFLGKKATSVSDTWAYYKAVGALDFFGFPLAERSTLSGWLMANGFPGGETVATYYNRGDLGFGRDMHCRVTSYGRACYVTNYGTVEDGLDDLADGSALNDALAHVNPGATVAMEWHQNRGANANPVRFFVYAPSTYRCYGDGSCGEDGGVLLDQIKLDGGAPQAVPGVCLGCHGGTFEPGNSSSPARVVGAQFLPFDVESFAYHDDLPRESQEQAFRDLNMLVRDTVPAGSSTRALIDGWYGSSSTFNGNFVPMSWQSSSGSVDLYRTVYRPYCQMCHTAQSYAPKTFADFLAQKNTIAFETSASSVLMPHSQVTFASFWRGSAREHLLEGLGVGGQSVSPTSGD